MSKDRPRPVPVLRHVEDLDDAWLSGALGRSVRGFLTEPIGTGQMSESHRVTLSQDGSSVVLKLASCDATSRDTGLRMGVYAREVRFYSEVAPTIGGALPDCLAAAYDPDAGWFSLVLEDAAPCRQGDQLAGCTAAEAQVALDAIAPVQAATWNSRSLAATGFLNGPTALTTELLTRLLPAFHARFGERVSSAHRAVVDAFVPSVDQWHAGHAGPSAISHGDFRLDNVLYALAGGARPATIVDWQSVTLGPPMIDIAYFLASGLPVETRRAVERDLLAEHHERLTSLGVQDYSWEQCWLEYRRAAYAGVLMMVASSVLVEQTERGDAMFMTSLARHAEQVLDLDATGLLS